MNLKMACTVRSLKAFCLFFWFGDLIGFLGNQLQSDVVDYGPDGLTFTRLGPAFISYNTQSAAPSSLICPAACPQQTVCAPQHSKHRCFNRSEWHCIGGSPSLLLSALSDTMENI